MINDYIKLMLEEHLHLSQYLNEKQKNNFYQKMNIYLNTRISEDTFINELVDLIELFNDIEIFLPDIITAIYNEPSLLHANKIDLFYKYLLLAKVVSKDTNQTVRKDIFVNHPKDLRVSLPVLYARIKYLENLGLVRTEGITRRKVLKITHEEFNASYVEDNSLKNKFDLINLYPFDEAAIEDILSWPDNEKFNEIVSQKYIGGGVSCLTY